MSYIPDKYVGTCEYILSESLRLCRHNLRSGLSLVLHVVFFINRSQMMVQCDFSVCKFMTLVWTWLFDEWDVSDSLELKYRGVDVNTRKSTSSPTVLTPVIKLMREKERVREVKFFQRLIST